MFCPKCGVSLPENTSFCSKCGHKLTNQVSKPVMARGTAERVRSFTPMGLVARAASIATIIFMMMPWLEVPAMRTLGQFATNIGVRVSSNSSFPMYNMGDLTKLLDFLSRSNAFSAIQIGFFFLWLVALLLVIAGLIRSFVGGRATGLLAAGGFVAAIVAVTWFAAIMFFDSAQSAQFAQVIGGTSQLFVVPLAVWGTAIAGIASAVCSRIR